MLRFSVKPWESFADTLNQAIVNPGADIIGADEVNSDAEIKAALEMSNKGIATLFSTHGGSITELIGDEIKNSLFGSLGSKTVSDDTAAKIGRNSTYDIDKPPAVDMVVVLDKDKTAYVYNDYQESISNLASGLAPKAKIFKLDSVIVQRLDLIFTINQKNMLKVPKKYKTAENKEVAKLRDQYKSNLDSDLEWLRRRFTELHGHGAKDARRMFRDVLVNSLRANNFLK